MAMLKRKMTVNKMLSDPNPQSRAVQELGHQGVDVLNLPKTDIKLFSLAIGALITVCVMIIAKILKYLVD